MPQGKFSADVGAWARKSKKRMLIVFQQSVQDVTDRMQTPVAKGGNLPVDTGFLRASLRGSIGTPVTGYLMKDPLKKHYTLVSAQYTLTINKAKLGDTIYLVYLANYAWYQEYGTQRMAGRGFVRLAAQQWQSIVADNVRKAQEMEK